MIYNIMQVESCLKKFLERGLIGYIFDLAASGYSHVKHVCSACLHMVPEHIPNMEDPLSLELVLCLLEAEGDKFSEISNKPVDVLTFPLQSLNRDTMYNHKATSFAASWAPFTCLVENFFTPALIYSPPNLTTQAMTATIDPSSISNTERHRKLKSRDYEDFQHSGHSDFNTTAEYPKQNLTEIPQGEDLDWGLVVDHGITAKDVEKKPSHLLTQDSDLRRPISPQKVELKTSRDPERPMLPAISQAVPINTVDTIKKNTRSSSSNQLLPASLSYNSLTSKKIFV